MTGTTPPPAPQPGLCAGCAHVRVVRSGRGSVFWMCERGLRREPGYLKYPRLPVVACRGYEASTATDPGTTEGR
ncbi:MAG: hypothetical protein AAGC46_03955 [Solirubrobacteraceae bacterium]|nr:hypothetical protein [Patulibacter sp.]